jgi:nucleoside-diphosphate-sugar epimerase
VNFLEVIRARRRRAAVWPRPARPPVAGGRILITGASGRIGGVLVDGLRTEHSVRGLDVAPSARADLVVDMRCAEDVAAAFAGIDTVIDLAAQSDARSGWEHVTHNNIPATLNALEAARMAGVRRVIFASSNRVTALAERDEPYASVVAGRYQHLDPATLPRLHTGAPVRPDGPYGIAKAMGEAAARYYAEEHGLSVLCLRIGSVPPEDRPMDTRDYAVFLSQRDLLALVGACLSASDTLRFGIYYGVSANRWRIWDIENAERELGYRPVDDAECWR